MHIHESPLLSMSPRPRQWSFGRDSTSTTRARFTTHTSLAGPTFRMYVGTLQGTTKANAEAWLLTNDLSRNQIYSTFWPSCETYLPRSLQSSHEDRHSGQLPSSPELHQRLLLSPLCHKNYLRDHQALYSPLLSQMGDPDRRLHLPSLPHSLGQMVLLRCPIYLQL